MPPHRKLPAILVAGTSSGSGKTTVTRGILSYLVTKGYQVQSYKLGPDYIDSGHHALITGRPCINLDRYLLSTPGAASPLEHSSKQLLEEFHTSIGDADALVIEAVGGLYDDWHNDKNSPAEIAKLLGVPAIIVMDARAGCQTAGIMANGLTAHDPALDILGFVFTKVNSQRHFQSITDGLSEKNKQLANCHLPKKEELHTEERHLGLHLAEEIVSENKTQQYADIFSQHLPFKEILAHQSSFPVIKKKDTKQKPLCRFAVARDRAFAFYYEYNLNALREAGAELIFFSPLKDTKLPDNIAGIYLGGGYPELYAKELSENTALRQQIKGCAEKGMPIYAECGGLMYLGEKIQHHKSKKTHAGVGIFSFLSSFSKKLYLGYGEVELQKDCLLGKTGTKAHCHVFHKSELKLHEKIKLSSSIYHETMKIKEPEGYTYKNVYASYAHLHFKSSPTIPISIIKKAIQWIE